MMLLNVPHVVRRVRRPPHVRTPQNVSDLVGCMGWRVRSERSILQTLRPFDWNEVDLIYFLPRESRYGPYHQEVGWIDTQSVSAEYVRLGLDPHPIAQLIDNAVDPLLHSGGLASACQWVDESTGRYCSASFDRLVTGAIPTVSIDYVEEKSNPCGEWCTRFWFAGVKRQEMNHVWI